VAPQTPYDEIDPKRIRPPEPADWGTLEKASNLRRPRLQRAALHLASLRMIRQRHHIPPCCFARVSLLTKAEGAGEQATDFSVDASIFPLVSPVS
jgi:hypothetical protein